MNLRKPLEKPSTKSGGEGAEYLYGLFVYETLLGICHLTRTTLKRWLFQLSAEASECCNDYSWLKYLAITTGMCKTSRKCSCWKKTTLIGWLGFEIIKQQCSCHLCKHVDSHSNVLGLISSVSKFDKRWHVTIQIVCRFLPAICKTYNRLKKAKNISPFKPGL